MLTTLVSCGREDENPGEDIESDSAVVSADVIPDEDLPKAEEVPNYEINEFNSSLIVSDAGFSGKNALNLWLRQLQDSTSESGSIEFKDGEANFYLEGGQVICDLPFC